MAEVTLHEGDSPSEEIVKAAKKVVEITDGLGRRLKIRKLNALHKLDLAQLVGEGSTVQAIMGPCAIAFSVIEIDGDPVMQPATYNELRHLVGRLDDEGLEAVTMAHVAHFGAAEGVDLDKLRELLKNS